MEGFDAKKQDEYAARSPVERPRDFISAHYYACSDDILRGLGRMYASGGEMTTNIDRFGGEGAAAFASDAIEAYLK